jgi:hypothetical protein
MSTGLFSAIDALVPAAPKSGDWDNVLERAGVRVSLPARSVRVVPRRRLRRRRVWVAFALLLLIALLATPAFGVQGIVLNLLGRKNVSFPKAASAPNEVKKQFADLAIGAPERWAPQVIAGQARVVGTFSVAGHQRKLWVAPTRRGGYCYTLERSVGGCRLTRADRSQGVVGASWMGGAPRSGVLESIVTRVAGDINAPAAVKLTATYVDGTTVDVPFVWVSKPIAAGFFTYDIPTRHWSKQHRLYAVSLFSQNGTMLGRQVFPFALRAGPRPIPTQSSGPKERRLPTRPDVAPSQPLQQGEADGFAVVVGHNGSVQFTQTGTTPILKRLVGESAGFGCFRLTKEFGIFSVLGLSQGGRFAPKVGFQLNGVGTPVDACEVQASIGRTWPDVLNNRAAVEIPFTVKGRAFFADRAAARDLALFVRSHRMQELRREPPTQALRDIRARYGHALSSSRIRITQEGNGLRFSETSPTGKTFFVLVQHVKVRRQGVVAEQTRITSQNVKPYTRVF